MNSGVTTSLKEARVDRELSHLLILHEKHSKNDGIINICQSVADTSLPTQICLWRVNKILLSPI